MSDELIYRVKLELDEKSRAELEKQLKSVESSAKAKSSGGSGGKAKDTEKEASALKELRQQLASYREELAKVNQQSSQNSTVSQSLRQEQLMLGEAIRNTSAQIQEANRGYSDQNTVLSSIPNTYNQLVEQNRALSLAMRDVPLDATDKRLQELQKRYKENNDKLKQFDATVGNHQRNVGDYENSLRSLASAIAVVQGPLGPLAGRLNSFATTLDKLKSKNAENVTWFGLLRTAMIALPVVALAAAIGALTQYFTRSEEGQIRFRVIMAQISGFMNTFRERAIELGKNLSTLWDSPSVAIEQFKIRAVNLGNAIVGSLVDRVKAVPDLYSSIFDGLIGTFQFLGAKVRSILADVPIIGDGIDAEKAEKDAQDAVLRVIKASLGAKDALAKIYNVDFITEPISNAIDNFNKLRVEATANAKISGAYEQALQRELVVQRELSVERAKQAKDFQQAREFVRDTNRSLDLRIAKIREVNAAEKELLDQELENERNILQIMQLQYNQFTSSKEEAEALAQQKIKVAQIVAKSSEKSMSALRDENALVRKQTELIEAEAQAQFDIRTGLRQKELDAETWRLEDNGYMLQAHLLRMEQIGIDAEERKQRMIDELNAKGFQQQFSDAEIAALAEQQVELEIARETQEAKQKLAEIEFNNRMLMAEQLSSGISALNSAFFNDSKELALASAIIDTYAAINKALKAEPGFPYNIGAVVAAGATGFANVKKIMNTKLGDKSASTSASKPQQPNVSTSFGLVNVGTNAPIAEQVAGSAGMPRQNMNPTFVFTGDLDPEVMAIKVKEGSNAISGKTVGIGI